MWLIYMRGRDKMIKQAELKQLELVKFITLKTIIDIYPHYYPKGAVDFFIEHHNAVSYTHLDVYKRLK